MRITNFEKKKMVPLRNTEYESYVNHMDCHMYIKKFEHKYTNNQNYRKFKDHYNYR